MIWQVRGWERGAEHRGECSCQADASLLASRLSAAGMGDISIWSGRAGGAWSFAGQLFGGVREVLVWEGEDDGDDDAAVRGVVPGVPR